MGGRGGSAGCDKYVVRSASGLGTAGSGSDQIDCNVDIAVCCFGVRARLMGFIHQGLGDLPLHTRQADVEASLEEAGAVTQAQIDFGLDGEANRQTDLPSAGST